MSGDITDDAVLARCITEDVNWCVSPLFLHTVPTNAPIDTSSPPRVGSIYHLAAVLSGGAEVDYELGLRVNVDGTRAIIRRCREVGHCPRLILTSSVAVFGPSQVNTCTAKLPQNRHTQK